MTCPPRAREANSRWLNQLCRLYVKDAASARKITADAISPSKEQLLQRLKAAQGNAATYALQQKLVDKLATRDQQVALRSPSLPAKPMTMWATAMSPSGTTCATSPIATLTSTSHASV